MTDTDWSQVRAQADQYREQDRLDRINEKVGQLLARSYSPEALERLPAPVPLIRGVMYRDSLMELYGKPGCGKSFIALDWAMSVASAKRWQGKDSHRGTVLYIVGEGSSGMGKRAKAWRTAWKHKPDVGDFTFLRNAVPLLDDEWVSALGSMLLQYPADLVVVDTLSRAIAGHNENAPDVMSKVVAHADWLRETSKGACLLFVHHATKDGLTNRGHSALEGACDVRWRVTKDGTHLTLTNEKTKDEAEHPTMQLRLRELDLGMDEFGQPVSSAVVESHSEIGWGVDTTPSEQALLGIMRDSFGTTGATTAQLREASELTKTTFYRALNSLVSQGELTNAGTAKRPHYFIREVNAA